MTGNHKLLGKGYLSPTDENALRNRIKVYEFSEPFVSQFHITPEQVADWILFTVYTGIYNVTYWPVT